MVRTLVPPDWKAVGENDFSIPIDWTLSGAEAALALVTPCWVWIALAGIVLR
jgi:hypothetical protein